MEGKRELVATIGVCFLISCSLAIAEDRTIDGSYNNLAKPLWGSAGSVLNRITSAAYDDEISDPAAPNRPSPRVVSDIVLNQKYDIPNTFGSSDYIWAWGQFIDHDMDITLAALPLEPFYIAIPPGDPVFDPDEQGGIYMPFERSLYDYLSGTDPSNPRQQINAITSWLDASMVYGSDPARAAWLRQGIAGRLKVTPHPTGDLLPFNDGTIPNAGGPGTDLFVAGDVRANEHAILTSLHTLFVREHNRQAALLAGANPSWSDEQIYQKARKLVGGEIQVITYYEFLPALLGQDDLPPYTGYQPQIYPNITNEFSTAAYRFGHSAVSPYVLRLNENLQTIPYGNLILDEAFFNPAVITEEGGIEPILRGLTYKLQQQIDIYIIDALRNNLFATLDLSSLNIQRGRDHGMTDYNTMRAGFGLEPFMTFAQLSNDPKVQSLLECVYGTINNIDPWVGMLAEHNHDGSLVGGLRHTIIKQQFAKLRDGDRFFYANDTSLNADEIAFLNSVRLKDIIELNTAICDLPNNVFYVPEGPQPDELFFRSACVYERYPLITAHGYSMDAEEEDLTNSDTVTVAIYIDNDPGQMISKTIPVSDGICKNGVFFYYGSDGIIYFQLDFVKDTFYIAARGLNPQNSITAEISLGQYLANGSTDELIRK